MRCSDEAVNALKEFEGLRLRAYKCPAGVWTVGYGHTGKDVEPYMLISEEQAEELFRNDLRFAEIYVEEWNPNCTQGEFDALVSLIYNIGVGAFSRSTLKKRIDANAPVPDIEHQWMRWVYGGGQILPGLKRRRAWEFERYIK
jgi:lysozyme